MKILTRQTIYIFSGLGADERVFQQMDLSDFRICFLKWLPVLPQETLASYARRMAHQITECSPILIGLSFGGIVAIEVAKQIPVKKVILLSSVKNRMEVPWYYRWIGWLGMDQIVPASLLKTPNRLTYYFFGASTSWERELLKEILKETDSIFLKWAIHSIVTWKNETTMDQIIHIHGTKDRILPWCYVTADYSVPGGGHLMILSHAKEIVAILRREIFNKKAENTPE